MVYFREKPFPRKKCPAASRGGLLKTQSHTWYNLILFYNNVDENEK